MARVYEHFKNEITRKQDEVDEMKSSIQKQLDILNEDNTLNGVVAGEVLKEEIKEIITKLNEMHNECTRVINQDLDKNNT